MRNLPSPDSRPVLRVDLDVFSRQVARPDGCVMGAARTEIDLDVEVGARLEGDLHFDRAMRVLYATDASEYREMPVAVALPTFVPTGSSEVTVRFRSVRYCRATRCTSAAEIF